jgi:hypothetical protein
MTAITNPSTGAWAPADVHPDRTLAEIHRRFPEACAWFGRATGSWWAMVNDRLIEAADPWQLCARLNELLAPRRQMPRPSTTHRPYVPPANTSARPTAPRRTQPGHSRTDTPRARRRNHSFRDRCRRFFFGADT